MKIGIMQPYFVPYLGYFQLINAVDKYVIYDDVHYIKGGWINRNRILINGNPSYFNVPLIGASPNKLINEIEVSNEDVLIQKNLRMLEGAYKKAPYFNDVYELMKDILCSGKTNLAEYLTYSIKKICEYLDINTEIVISSELNKDNSLRGKEKVVAIVKELGGTTYYNAIGGQELYSFDYFKENGLELGFIKTNLVEYKQYNNEFQPYLSIVDIMMFNSKEEVKKMLDSYEIIKE